MKRATIILAIFWVMLNHPCAYGATYYVNGSGAAYVGGAGTYGAGADTAETPGSLSSPWATIQYAESRIASSGDTVYVAASTYAENDSTNYCLTLTKAATWIADGTVEVRPYSSTVAAVTFTATSNAISMSGFIFDGSLVNGASDATYGVRLLAGANNKTLVNCTFRDSTTYLMYCSGTATGLTLTSCTFTGSPSGAGIYFSNVAITCTNITVESFTSADFFYSTSDTSAMSFSGGTITASVSGGAFRTSGYGNLSVSNMDITLSPNVSGPGRCINVNTGTAGGIVDISDNQFVYNLSGGTSSDHIIYVGSGTHNVSIKNNYIYCDSIAQERAAIYISEQPTVSISGNEIIYLTESSSIATTVWVRSTGTTMTVSVENNRISSKQRAGRILFVGTDTSSAGDNYIDGAVITGNIITADTASGASNTYCIEYGYNENGTIKGNYCYGGGYGVVIKGVYAYTSGGVFYNVLANQLQAGIRVRGSKNLPIYNNTLIVESGFSSAYGLLYITVNADSSNTPSTGSVLKNNLFYSQNEINTINCDADSVTAMVIDYNLHYMAAGSSQVYALIGATQYSGAASWAAWQAAGYDANGLNADPKLSSIRKLIGNSPCINAGTNVGLTTDFMGLPIKGNPDIGAYEYYGSLSRMAFGFGYSN